MLWHWPNGSFETWAVMMIAREGQQAERRRRPAFSAFLFGILALSFVFLSLATGPSSIPSLTRIGDGGFAISFRGAPCLAERHRSDAPPAKTGDHSQCCVLCSARDFDGATLAGATQKSEAFAPRPALVVAAVRRRETRVRPPTGWASSWSSQAPPIFS